MLRLKSVFGWRGVRTSLVGFLFIGAMPATVRADSIRFFENATESPHFALVEGARDRIDIEVYTVNDLRFRQALLAAQSRGVKLRILQEAAPVNSECFPFTPPSDRDSRDCVELKTFIAEVRHRGGVYEPFRKEAFCPSGGNCFQHGKVLRVDARFTLISTGNFDSSSFCPPDRDAAARCNRDYSLVLDDPNYARAITEIFERDLAGVSYDLAALLDRLGAPGLTVSPLSRKPLVALIRSARRSISIENQYLNDASLNAELVEASRRGVKVRVMIASICSIDKPTSTERRRLFAVADFFAKSGIEARAFTGNMRIRSHPGYLHAKAILVDESTAWVGSVNGSTTAIDANREFGLAFTDRVAISRLKDFVDGDFASSGSTSLLEDVDCKIPSLRRSVR